MSTSLGLLGQRGFRRYWAAQSVSFVGDQVSVIVLPLVALSVGADVAQVGLITAAAWLPSLLFSAAAGAWADRRRHRRRIMIATDLGRLALLASIPAAHLAGALTLVHLGLVAFAAGTLSVVFSVCNAPLFPALVPVRHYVAGNALISGSRATAQLGGPLLGGGLVQLVAAPFALLADAATFAASAFWLARISPAEPPPQPRAPGQIRDGARFLVRAPVLRAALVAVAIVNLFTMMISAVFVVYATTTLGLAPGVLGAVLGAGALGGLAGAWCAGPLTRRIGIGPTFITGCLLFPAPMLLLPLAHGSGPGSVALLVVAELGSGIGVMWLDVAASSIFTAFVPDSLRSRVFGVFQTVNFGTRPFGALAGGAFAAAVGIRPTLWIAAAAATTAWLWLVPTRVRGLRELPAATRTAPARRG